MQIKIILFTFFILLVFAQPVAACGFGNLPGSIQWTSLVLFWSAILFAIYRGYLYFKRKKARLEGRWFFLEYFPSIYSVDFKRFYIFIKRSNVYLIY